MKKRRRLISIVAIVLIVLMVLPLLLNLLSGGSAQAQATSLEDKLSNYKSQAEELEQKNNELKSQIDSLQYQQTAVIAQKEVLDERMNVTCAEIDNLTAQIATYDELIENKKLEVIAAEEAETRQFQEFKERIRAMEENGTISYLAIILEADSFENLLDRVDMVSEIMEADRSMATSLEKAKNETIAAKLALEQTQEEQKATKQDLEAKEAELTVQREEAAQLIAELESDIEAYVAVYEENEKEMEEIQQQINDVVEEMDRIEREKLQNAAAVVATGSFIWPSNTTRIVTSVFGTRFHPVLKYYRTHNGTDIGASYGTDILAADGGVVAIAQRSSSYGNYIVINHGNGTTTLYAHCSRLLVSVGDVVTQGQVIGYVGDTGIVTGPHLHFEVSVNGTRVNPLDYFTNYVIID